MQVAEGGSRVSRSGPTGIRGGADEGAGAAERKETRRLCWSPRVETRKRGAAAKCPPPRRPRPPGESGIPANGRGPCGAWPAHRCRPGPPVPSPPPSCVRLGGGPGLRSLRLPPHLRLPAPPVLQPGTPARSSTHCTVSSRGSPRAPRPVARRLAPGRSRVAEMV